MVAVERVPASTRIGIRNLCQARDEHCSQDLADHFACVAQRHRDHCVSSDLLHGEVTEPGVQIFPDENRVIVSFHCRPGAIASVIVYYVSQPNYTITQACCFETTHYWCNEPAPRPLIGRPFVKRFILRYRTVVCPACLCVLSCL